MARSKRWDRYQPPPDKRTESGRKVAATATPKSRPPAKPKRPPASKKTTTKDPTKSPKKGPAVPLVAVLIAGFVIIVVIAVVVAVNSESEAGGDNPDVDRSLLTVDFIGSSLTKAKAEEGEQAVSVRLDEYGMSVEYFDPNKKQIRRFENHDKTGGGYTIRVEDSYYADYQPRPFDLAVLNPASMLAAVDAALASADNARSFSLNIEVDRETGEVAMVTNITGDETIRETTAP